MNNDLGLICSSFEMFHEAISFEQNRLLKSSYTQEIFHKKNQANLVFSFIKVNYRLWPFPLRLPVQSGSL